MNHKINDNQDPEFIISKGESNSDFEALDFLVQSSKGTVYCQCVRGRALLLINHKQYEVTAPSLFIVFPHYYQFKLVERSDDFLVEYIYCPFGIGIDFLMNGYTLILDKIGVMPYLSISEEEMVHLSDFYHFIYKQAAREGHLYRKDNIRILMSLFVSEIDSIYTKREINPHRSVRKEELIRIFFELIFRHHQEEHRVSFYAEKMCISTKYLSKIVKNQTGMNVPYWINKFLILEAKASLRRNEKTVSQISDSLNFPNPSFFIRFFKKYERKTPAQFRNAYFASNK